MCPGDCAGTAISILPQESRLVSKEWLGLVLEEVRLVDSPSTMLRLLGQGNHLWWWQPRGFLGSVKGYRHYRVGYRDGTHQDLTKEQVRDLFMKMFSKKSAK